MNNDKFMLYGGCVLAIALYYSAQVIKIRTYNLTPAHTRFEDVNEDGIEDKLIQKKIKHDGGKGIPSYSLEDEVLYGVRVNGKIIYLTEEQFKK